MKKKEAFPPVSLQIRKEVVEHAFRHCEYCFCPSDYSTSPYAVEHKFRVLPVGRTIWIIWRLPVRDVMGKNLPPPKL
jgi:hypothetical protein